jgi:uncharacterized protein with von Willebrand factor type A (vWA) domain
MTDIDPSFVFVDGVIAKDIMNELEEFIRGLSDNPTQKIDIKTLCRQLDINYKIIDSSLVFSFADKKQEQAFIQRLFDKHLIVQFNPDQKKAEEAAQTSKQDSLYERAIQPFKITPPKPGCSSE